MGRHRRIDIGQYALLQVFAFGQTFLNEIGILDRFGDAGGEGQLPFGWQRCAVQPGLRPARVGDHFEGLTLDLGIGIEHRHIDPVQQEPRCPGRTDYPAADNRDLVHLRHVSASAA